MKNNLFFILLIVGINSCTTLKKLKPENNLELVFGHCFKKDTISLTINSTSIIQNLILTTDIQQGLTPYTLIFRANSIYLNDKEVLSNVSFPKDLTFLITRNTKEKFLISKNLRKGKYFVSNRWLYNKRK